MGGWVVGWVGGWVGGWVDVGWMDGWMFRHVYLTNVLYSDNNVSFYLLYNEW